MHGRRVLVWAGIVALSVIRCVSASEADDAFDQGRKLLAEAMVGDDAKLVPAAKFFIVGQQKYVGEERLAKAQEAQACLYWCKKKMPMKEAEAFANNIPDKFKTVYEYEPAVDEAQQYFLRARDYAMGETDPLLVAIRWFEVADRFKGEEVSLIAQQRSLDAMQKVQMKKVTVDPTDTENLKPDAKAPDVDAAIKETYEPYAEAVAEAKKEYIEDLRKALEYEMGKGNLEAANAVKAEIDRMADADALSSNEIDSKKAERAAKSFDRNIEKARDQYQDDLEDAMKKATKAGDLEAANRIREEMGKCGYVLPNDDDSLYEYLKGSRWKFSKERILTLNSDGKVNKSWGRLSPEWSVKNMRLIYEGKTFSFFNDFKEMKEDTKKEFEGSGKLLK